MYKVHKKAESKKALVRSWLRGNRMIYFLACLVSVAVVFLAVQSSTIGAKVRYLEDKEKKLLGEYELLEEELANKDSLTKISEKAGGYLFNKPQKIVYSREENGVGMNLR